MLKFISLCGIKGEPIRIFLDKIVSVSGDPDDSNYSYISLINGDKMYVNLPATEVMKTIFNA